LRRRSGAQLRECWHPSLYGSIARRTNSTDDSMRSSLMPANGRTADGDAASVRLRPIRSHQFVPIWATTEQTQE
jgi:hypothetical protein